MLHRHAGQQGGDRRDAQRQHGFAGGHASLVARAYDRRAEAADHRVAGREEQQCAGEDRDLHDRVVHQRNCDGADAQHGHVHDHQNAAIDSVDHEIGDQRADQDAYRQRGVEHSGKQQTLGRSRLVGVQQRDEHEGVEAGEAEHLGDEHAPLERVGEQPLQAAGRFGDEGMQTGGQRFMGGAIRGFMLALRLPIPCDARGGYGLQQVEQRIGDHRHPVADHHKRTADGGANQVDRRVTAVVHAHHLRQLGVRY